jgi:threonine/homoserine/homoserine lactone efflux protein
MDTLLSMPHLPLFLTSALILLLTPGPAVLYVVARSVDQGRKAGLASVLGVELGNLCHAMGAALGVSAILLSSALAFNVVKYLGAAYLIYLGIRKFTAPVPAPDAAPSFQPKSLRRIFSQGVVVSVLNPKTALFFFAFLPQFIDTSRGSAPAQMLFLGIIFVTMAACTDSLYALAAGTAGRWLRGSARYLRFEKYVTGTIYIGLGLVAAFSGGEKK